MLKDLKMGAGNPTYETIIKDVSALGTKLNKSSLGDWFAGHAVPADKHSLGILVTYLAKERPLPGGFWPLYEKAKREGAARRGARPASGSTPESATDPASGAGELRLHRLPRIDTVHYANVPRLRHLLSSHEIVLDLPDLSLPGERDMMELLAVMDSITRGLARVALPVKKLTQEFRMRSLDVGDLLVFDRRVFTLNGPSPGETPSLTGDYDVDPLIHFTKRGVRIVMPYDPVYVTTSTAYSDFKSRHIQMVGLCVIKRRGKPTDAPHRKKTPKVQFVASPLVLGLSSERHRDPELTKKVVFKGYDDDGTQSWFGEWVSKRSDGDPS
ncbi:hypothetical protein A0W34_29835 (plasmid) [Rhodococcus sp. BH4]|nr:hypothetical protein A0W34_29835 [Rhodococcus sp. BH4]